MKQQKQQENKKLASKKQTAKGFTLIEALISIFIFALAMTMISGTFSNFLRNFSAAKKMQKDIENAQYAMNIMAKTIRTSTMSSGSQVTINSFPLNIFDYSQGRCIQYSFVAGANGGKIQVSTTSDATQTQFSDCHFDAAHLTGTSDLTTSDINSYALTATSSDSTTTPTKFGKVVLAVTVKEAGQSGSGVPIETFVSLRQ